MAKKSLKYIYITIVLAFALTFVAIFGKSAILKAYVTSGIGGYQTESIFCNFPAKNIVDPEINKTYIQELLPYAFVGIDISIPKGFTVVKGKVTKVYYKRRKYDAKTPTIYLLYQKPIFFVNLFPRLKKRGIENNYEFLLHTMSAQLQNINDITDAFFVIMKSIFTPNLGEGGNIKMVKFELSDKRGFINYNLTSAGNYFDCNVVTKDDTFFKIYIKDKEAALDLHKVLAIISTLHAAGNILN